MTSPDLADPLVLAYLSGWHDGYHEATSRLLPALETACRQALTDPLTGLPNRRATDWRLASAGPDVLWLGLVDVCQLKLVNDTRGHAAGDQLLKAVASVLSVVAEPWTWVARHGGDEFLTLWPCKFVRWAAGRTRPSLLKAEILPFRCLPAIPSTTATSRDSRCSAGLNGNALTS